MLNRHNVIYIDFSVLPDPCDNYRQHIDFVKMKLFLDIKEYYNVEKVPSLPINDYLIKTKDTFIFILDEWDSIFHKEFMTEKNKKEYLEFLQGLLKNKPYVELAYMTGVQPIAKYSSDSQLNMFIEHNVLNDSLYDDYFGFNEEEVKKLCIQHNKPTYEELKFWYDGYQKKDGSSIFNPRSIRCAFRLGECQNFWTETGPMNEVSSCIEHNVYAVREDIVNMVAGQSIKVKLKGFSPIESQLMTRNEILTAMVIYGFLSYHNGELRIPNREIMEEFEYTLHIGRRIDA